jgi:release factor glutamine methyltransferase
MINLNKNVDFRIVTVLKQSEQALQEVGIESGLAKLEVTVLLSYVLSKPKSYFIAWPEAVVNQGQYAMYQALLERRINGEPLAYIIGQKEFFSLLLKVTPDTLIPRPETELLVETILERFKNHKLLPINILDLGTGSGAIAIALAKTRPAWQITAIDKSEQALNVAKENAEVHQLSNINFIKSDWFSNLQNNIKYDCIVANPPYLAADDPHLTTEIKFEPKTALVADNNGLADLKYIISQAHHYLNPKGILILEHGFAQQAELEQIIEQLKSEINFVDYDFLNDYATLPRAVIIKW